MRLLLSALTLAAVTIAAAPAQAHTLTRDRASLAARIELADYAEYRYGSDVSYPSITKRDCKKRSQHAMRCHGNFKIYDYSEYGVDQFCTADVRVSFRNARSLSVRTKVYNVTCY